MTGRPKYRAQGFSLIELLIVVAIIAILAAIAVPNFLESQTRAKVARVKMDLRTIALALETYGAQSNQYPPNDGVYNVTPVELSTPVAFLTQTRLLDPFTERDYDPVYGDLARQYTYDKIVTGEQWQRMIDRGETHMPAQEAVDSPQWNPGALAKYGLWRLVSNGPDRVYLDPSFVFGSDPLDPNGVLQGSDVPYDPTNGTASAGNILRTQRSAASN